MTSIFLSADKATLDPCPPSRRMILHPGLENAMQQQIAVITLGSADLARTQKFFSEGFGWQPVFQNDQILFYQMNGFVLSIFQREAMAEDMGQTTQTGPAAMALAHNVATEAEVSPLMERLVRAGGRVLRPADAPPHGGFRGYVTDPDDHAWEIAWNPHWPISSDGHVTFAL